MCRIYFFIGTVAELIKITPVLVELYKCKINYEIISSGQNDLSNKNLYNESLKAPLLFLSKPPKYKTAFYLFIWFFSTLTLGYFRLKKYLNNRIDNSSKIMIVHGDTLSTLSGSILAKLLGMKVGHIEAGLRSGNLLNPFPEEIDRVITSLISDYHFCPGDIAVSNLKNHSGYIINTFFNTNIESISIALNEVSDNNQLQCLINEKFFIFVMHRQENLINSNFVRRILAIIINESTNLKCLFIIHEPTYQKLFELNLLIKITNAPNIIVSERLSHKNFVNILTKAAFIITDSGGNQEESYYLGTPCLLLRKVTERYDGLNENVVLSYNDIDNIKSFIKNYKIYARKPLTCDVFPSKIIVKTLNEFLNS